MSIYEAFKDAIGLAKKIENVELYQKLIDLQGQTLEIQSANVEMQQKINFLESENKHLKEMQKANAEDVVFDNKNPFFTLKSEDNKIKYCSNCWRKNGEKVQFSSPNGLHNVCPVCKTIFQGRI